MHKMTLNDDNMHWVLQILQTMEVGLIVFDKEYRIEVWNGFMENHSDISSDSARGQQLFELLPSLPQNWFTYKAESVFTLGIQAHCNWRQEPHSLLFENIRPFTAHSEYMFQNITLFPLHGKDGAIERVCALIYDVTEEANNLLQLESVSRTDALTQLFNRGHWYQMFEQEFARCQRYEDPAAVILLDIDHFKSVNDNYGHQVGDKAIQLIANIIRDNQRETDISGRYGGEEFALVLPKTTLDEAKVVAERLRQQVEKTPLEYQQDNTERSINLTISAGVAEFNRATHSPDQWLQQADEALYQAKSNGRNQVM